MLYRRFRHLRNRERFRAWLVRVTWRLALDRQRTDRRRVIRESEPPTPQAAESTTEALAARERAVHVWRAIDALPQKLRIVVVLANIDGHDIGAVARLLAIPEGTVKSRLFAARARLKEQLRWLKTIADTDAELDAALAEAFASDPSPDFVARVRERLATEDPDGPRSLPIVAVTVTLAAVAMVFVIVMLERRPTPAQTSAQGAVVSDSGSHTTTPLPMTTAPTSKAFQRQSATSRPVRLIRQETPGARNEVLIPVGEQQALRRLLERPPTAMVRLATPDDPMEVAAIAIPPLRIDPLSSEVEEGGQQ